MNTGLLPLFASIPIALFPAALVLHLSGTSLNMMSISGIAVSTGLCVDGSVLAFETTRCYGISYFRRRTAVPILLSTLSTLAVFAPLPLFPPQLTLRYSALALVAVPALISSTVYTILLLPALTAETAFGPGEKEPSPHGASTPEKLEGFHSSMRRIYRLGGVFRRGAKPALFCALLLLLAAIVIGSELDFLPYPRIPSRSVSFRYEFPAGTVAETVLEELRPVESELLASVPGGELRLSARKGRGVLTLFHPARTVRTACRRRIEERFGQPGCGGRLFVEGGGRKQSGISLHFFGTSFLEAAESSAVASRHIGKLLPQADISLHFKQASPSYRVTIPPLGREEARKSPADTAANLLWAFSSAPFEKVFAGGMEHDVLLEPEPIYGTPGAVGIISSLEGTPSGRTGTLRGRLSIEREFTYASVYRRSTVPSAGLTVAHPAMKRGDLAALLEREFPEALVAPELKKEKRLRSYNILLLAAAFLIVALVLYAYFGYLSTTIACLLQIPLSYVLPALLLALLELPLSIPTLSGFLLLTGVSVNNGIVLFGGGDSGSALLSADCDPLLNFAHKEHPLLLSALTTAAGVLPTALTGLGTAGVLAPLSIVVASGTAGSYLFLYLQCGLVLAWSDRRSSPPVPPFGRSDRRGLGHGHGHGYGHGHAEA